MLYNLMLVAIGGAAGAGARFLVNTWALYAFGPGFPWGTFAVNILGSFAMGVIAQAMVMGADLPVGTRLLIMTGILGGFTTFSAFALDIVLLVERGEGWLAAGYAMLSVAGAVAALVLGQLAARAVL